MKPIFFTLLLLPFIDSNAQNTIFVNLNVQAGQQNGNTWADAFPDLQQALFASNYGDEIWVAQGTYFPTTTTDRSISFVLKNGVKIYGGFQGSETSQVQRDFESNQTILSGNIGLPNGSDNSYHVVYGEGLDSTTILDGFVVTKGIATGSGNSDGGGLLIEPSTSVYNTCPIIQNCRFEANYATVGGGVAIKRWSFSQNYANPIIRNCQFVSNRASLHGGGMVKVGPAIMDQPFVLENCTFFRNSSKTEGGGVFFSHIENTTILKHCVFEQDTSTFSLGGGVYFGSGYEEFTGAILKMDSCTFKENRATEGGGIYYNDGGLPSFSIPPFHATLSDCIFERNVATNGYGGGFSFIGVTKSALTIDLNGCEFKGNVTGSYYTTYFQAGKGSFSKVSIENCKYTNNTYLNNPSLICYPISFGIGGFESRLDARIENCLFVGNGGGVSSLCTIDGGGINTYITNCTFFNNNEYLFNKSYYSVFNGVDHFADTYLTNCVIWQPGANLWNLFSDNDFMLSKLDGYKVEHCLLSLDSSITGQFPIFGDHNISETDPLFVNVPNGDFRLEACSPAVNSGNNLIVDTLGILTDLDGNPRIRFDTVDLGAYETQTVCFTSATKTPLKPLESATVSPNPASPGAPLVIQVSGWGASTTEWQIWDALGHSEASGIGSFVGVQGLSLEAPRSSGLYFVELNDGTRSVWLKLLVE